MLERARGRHGWRRVPASEWLEKAAHARELANSEFADDTERLLEIAEHFEQNVDLRWACMLDDDVLAHWTDEDYEDKLSLLRHGEATLAGWNDDELTYWLFGGELFVTDDEDLDADDVRALILGESEPAAAPANGRTVSDVIDDLPIISENVSFMVSQRHRVAALTEFSVAESHEDTLEALLIVNHTMQWQMDETSAVFEAIGERETDDPERDEAIGWMKAFLAWMERDGRELMELQNDLVKIVGRERAQEIADTRGTPRLQAILDEKKRVATDRYNEARVRAGLPRIPYPDDTIDGDDTQPAAAPPPRGRIIDL